MKRLAMVLLCACLAYTPAMAETAPEMPEDPEKLWVMYLDLLERVEALEAKLNEGVEESKNVESSFESENEEISSATGTKFEFTVLGVSECDSLPGYGGDVLPAEGKIFVVVEIEAHNITDTDYSIGLFNYDTYADGYSVNSNPYFSSVRISNLLNGDLRAGKRMVGVVYVEADPDWKEVEVNYEESWDSTITVIASPDDIAE